MEDRKKAIRPVLNLNFDSEQEEFQNKTLRPILKLQHHLVLVMFICFCKKQKLDIFDAKSEDFLNKVITIIKKNIVLRNQLLGIIIGHFTQEEFSIYKEKDSEYNKRILNMIGQRISDSQSEIKK